MSFPFHEKCVLEQSDGAYLVTVPWHGGQENHPIFQDFPTEHSGGWQWEDILAHARGFRLTQKSSLTPIVRIIDDWNRNLALSLLLEARVGKGRLLLVSACLEGDPKERPAAYFLKQAILRYVSSESFAPTGELSREEIEENLFPIGRMEEIVEDWDTDEDTTVSRKEALFDPNPNTSVRLERAEFPVTVHFSAKEKEGQQDCCTCRSKETGPTRVS